MNHGTAIRCLFFIFNFISWTLGISFIAVGGCLLLTEDAYSNLSDGTSLITITAFVIIGLGTCMFLAGLFGCIGAWKYVTCLLVIYSLFFLILIIAQLIFAGFLFLNLPDLSKEMEESLYDRLTEYRENKGVVQVWDSVQSHLHCCGVRSVEDWVRVPGMNFPPDSCLSHDSSLYYTIGCYQQTEDTLYSISTYIGISALVVCVVQLLAVVTSLRLICVLQEDPDLM